MLKCPNNNCLGGGRAQKPLCIRLFKAFTLAEVLITLSIVGIVAALTLPTLMTKITQKVENAQNSVINSKIIKGLNLLSIDGGMKKRYNSSEDFVRALSKHLKMINICSQNNLGDCFVYDTIKYEDKDGENSIKVSNITPAELHLEGGFNDLAAFIMGDGTMVMMSYDKNCRARKPDQIYRTIHPCVAGFYDLNGNKRPNKAGIKTYTYKKVSMPSSDIRMFNGASLGCMFKVGNVCIISTAFEPQDITTRSCDDDDDVKQVMSKSTCDTRINTNHGQYSLDAMIMCKKWGGRIMTANESLATFYPILFGGQRQGAARYENSWDADILNALELPSSPFCVYDGYGTCMYMQEKYSGHDWAKDVYYKKCYAFCVK